MKNKKKDFISIAKSIRGTWTMNPITRVHDNKKSKKKERSEGKNKVKEALKEYD